MSKQNTIHIVVNEEEGTEEEFTNIRDARVYLCQLVNAGISAYYYQDESLEMIKIE